MGDRWHYPEEVLYRIGVIQQMRAEGLSLPTIAERLRGVPTADLQHLSISRL